MKVRLFFAWFAFWIGIYWDRERELLYIALLPCVVIEIKRHADEATEPTRGICPKCKHDRESHVGIGGCMAPGKYSVYCPCGVSRNQIPPKTPGRGILAEIGQTYGDKA